MNKRFLMSTILMGLYNFAKAPIEFSKDLFFKSQDTGANKLRLEPKSVARANGTWFHKSFNNQQLIGKLMYFKTKRGKKLYRIISRTDRMGFSYRLQSIEHERAA